MTHRKPGRPRETYPVKHKQTITAGTHTAKVYKRDGSGYVVNIRKAKK